jgi:hypothetical protein
MVAHRLTLQEQRMSGMVKGSSSSVVSASAQLIVPVVAVLVHQESAQAQGHQPRRERRDAVSQQSAAHPSLSLRQLQLMVLKP